MNVKCELCEIEKPVNETKDWEVQHLHFDDANIDFLTCNNCKLASPSKYLEKLKQIGGADE